VSWHCNIEPALSTSIRNLNRMLSVCLLRTLLPRVMTAKPIKLGMGSFCYLLSAAARHTPTIGDHPHPRSPICRGVTSRPGPGRIGGPSPSPSPICRGSGVHPRRHPRFAGDRVSIPAAIPDLPGIGGPSPPPSPICRGSGVHPHPRFKFPSGVPCPASGAAPSGAASQ
jgi:hypothetical protein